MKFQLQAVAALTLTAGATAFCPTPVRIPPVSALAMSRGEDVDMGKAAISFMAASVIAVSSSMNMLPVEPAFAATTTTTTVEKVQKVEKVKKVEKAPKVDLKKLAPEERNKITAKQNLDLAEQSVKEYTKYAAEAKGAEAKASAALKNQEKIVAAAKKTVITDSDKLSAAKNQQMPQAAIKELSAKAGKSLSIEMRMLPSLPL